MRALSYLAVGVGSLLVGAAGAKALRGRRPDIAHDPRRVGLHQERRGLDPRLRRLPGAQGQGAGSDRHPRDLRPHRLGAHGRRPVGQGGVRRGRARSAFLQVRPIPEGRGRGPEAGRRPGAGADHRPISTRPTATSTVSRRCDKGDIGTIGFCWGGGQSFRYATNNPNLTAVVVCYGPRPTRPACSGSRRRCWASTARTTPGSTPRSPT